MNLIYIDESGNTGNNLADPQQPVFVLCALIVPEGAWSKAEGELAAAVEQFLPKPWPARFEIHGKDLRNGGGFFRGIDVPRRLAIRDAWLQIAQQNGFKVVYRAIEKRRYLKWEQETFGPGVQINPHVVAFPLLAQVVNAYLDSGVGRPQGIFVSDENKEIALDVEKSIRILRGTEGPLKLSRIIEKGFFINSAASLLLQLCDVCAYSIRKWEETRLGQAAREIDTGAFDAIGRLIHRGAERWQDVLAWVAEQQKKERPGT